MILENVSQLDQGSEFAGHTYDKPIKQYPPSATQRPPSPFEGDEPDHLIGIRPEFDGDRANTLTFLMVFKNFIRLNSKTRIARDPFITAAYFLNILRGPSPTPAIELFIGRNLDWVSRVESNPDLLPEGTNVWAALEAEFKKSFEDYLGPMQAQTELEKLYMKEDPLDDYIADFERLARRAGLEPIQGPTVHRFARGLPRELIKACIDHGNPKTFDQWVNAARRVYARWQDCNRLRQPPTRGATAVGGRNGQPDAVPRARFRTTLRDSNPRMTVGTNRKATTEDDKENYRREGRCFHCGTKGHLVRNCPNRPSRPSGPTTERK